MLYSDMTSSFVDPKTDMSAIYDANITGSTKHSITDVGPTALEVHRTVLGAHVRWSTMQ